MPESTIGEWSQDTLVRFIQEMLRNNPVEGTNSVKINQIEAVQKLICSDQIQFTNVTSAVGAAGGATALPATPAGYLRILDDAGLVKVVPYYNV